MCGGGGSKHSCIDFCSELKLFAEVFNMSSGGNYRLPQFVF